MGNKGANIRMKAALEQLFLSQPFKGKEEKTWLILAQRQTLGADNSSLICFFLSFSLLLPLKHKIVDLKKGTNK